MLIWIILGYISLVCIALIPKQVSIYIKFLIIPIVSAVIFGLFHWNEWSKTDWSFLILDKKVNLFEFGTYLSGSLSTNADTTKTALPSIKQTENSILYMMFIFISCIVLYICYACLILYGLGVILLTMLGISYNSHGHAPPAMAQSMRPIGRVIRPIGRG
jgi:hypothetical protein